MQRTVFLFVIFLFSVVCVFPQNVPVTQGTLTAVAKDGSRVTVPLRHTDVKAEITGFLARVTVKQDFENKFDRPIEAVYAFPLSQKGAVDSMTMTIGSRVIRGKILKRKEARRVYENAKRQGRTASLLEQERPNIFTQSVANILPGENIFIEISYVETLKYEDGSYEFVFPMVVGPRYVPGNPVSKKGSGFSPDTAKVPDGSRITPRVAANRAGHDISITVMLDAGVPIQNIESSLHSIASDSYSANIAKVTLKDAKTIPNRDFVLNYQVSGNGIGDALLAHRDKRGGFFTLILQPPGKFGVEDVAPKEIVFVLDTSGSMSGFPIEKAKEAIELSLKGLNPHDTFNLITFAGDTHILFEKPAPATGANLGKALEFLRSRSGGGGTEMMKAIRAALEPSDSREHLRIVSFMTDGYVGNEGAIIDEVKKHKNARVFSFGIGNSVNRYLLEKMAEEGLGEVEFVSLKDDGSKAARRFYERVRSPLLTDVSIEWNGLPVADLYPARIPDLFSSKPVIVNGRYTKGATGSIILRGKIGDQYFQREIKVELPESEARHDVLATLWARKRIDELTRTDYRGVQNRDADKGLEAKITSIGLEFRLMTQYTSFVAVEERIVNHGGKPVRIDVPVELAEGTFGDGAQKDQPSISLRNVNRLAQLQSGTVNYSVVTRSGSGSGKGNSSGRGTGYGSGVAATVTVTSGANSVVNTQDSKVNNEVSSRKVANLPKGTNFKSMLKIAPAVKADAASGGLQIDGASGAESTFIVDGQEIKDFRAVQVIGAKGLPNRPITSSVAKLEKPSVPKKTKWKKAGEIVKVEISVDEKGDVISAKATTGDGLLRKPSEKAALKSKFTPAEYEDTALPMSGVLSYRFISRKQIEITLLNLRVRLTPAVKLRILQNEKLHFWLLDLVRRLESGSKTPSGYESNFVFDGKAEIRVLLQQNTPEAVEDLKQAGMEIDKVSDVKVTGRIAPEKLTQLVHLENVRYISP